MVTIIISQQLNSSNSKAMLCSTHVGIYYNHLLVTLKCTGIQERPNKCLKSIHHKHSTNHSTVTKGGTTIKTKERALLPYNFGCLNKRAIRLSLNVSLHTSLDGVKRVSEVTSEEATQKSSGNAGLTVAVKFVRVRFS